MRIIIKKFTELSADELYEILKIRSDIFVVEQQCLYADCDDKDRYAYHLFIEKNGSVQGYLRILEKGQAFDEMAIGRLAVRQEYRRIGLARHMMVKALYFVTEYLHEKAVKISAQQYLTEFYESLGFHAVSKTYVEDEIIHVEMEYRIP